MNVRVFTLLVISAVVLALVKEAAASSYTEEEVAKVFKFMDADRSGKLEYMEVMAFLKLYGPSFPEEAYRKIVLNIILDGDKNGDMQVDKEEFIKHLTQ